MGVDLGLGLQRNQACGLRGSPTLGPWAGSVAPDTHTCPQLFITVMDKLRLEIRAMDEVWLLVGQRDGGLAQRWEQQ